MNEKEIRKALQEVATAKVGNEIDLWPDIERRVRRPSRVNLWQWGMRLAGTAVAVLVLILFISWFTSLSHGVVMDEGSGMTVETPTMSPALSITIAPELVFPHVPTILPRYEVAIVPSPQTPEAMLVWARAFGQPGPKIYRDPRSPEVLLSVGSDNSRLIFPKQQYGISYLPGDWQEEGLGETISLAAGTAVAEAFLAEHHQLPSTYHVVDQISNFFSADHNSIRFIQFAPDLNGYPVLQGSNYSVGPGLLIDAAGEVFSAGFAEVDFHEVDTVSLRPAEDVVTDFVNGRLIPLAQHLQPAFDTPIEYTAYYPPLPEHTIGERVTILETDDTHFLIAEDDSEVRATLATRIGGKYELITPDLAHIAETIEYNELRVTGTIVAQMAPDTWRLNVESWEILPQQAISSGCATGPIAIEESGTWIVAESVMSEVVRNGRYQINNLPADIQNGDRIEVCAEPIPNEGEPLPWSVIYAPPRDLSQSPTIPDAYVIEDVQLVYFHDLEDPELALAQPAWMVSGHAPYSTSRFVAYLDAVQR